MARFRKPFFKQSHDAWYVQLDGRQVRLGPDKAAAFEKYHELMADRRKAQRLVTPGEAPPLPLGDLRDRFLAAAFKGRSPATAGWYADKLGPLVAHLGPDLPARDLTPARVDDWAAAHPDWSAGTARNLWRAVQRLYRWGRRRGLVPESAVLHQEKPRGGKREVVIPPAEYALMAGFVRNDELKALLAAAWETGARPQELLRARARHLDRENKRLVFPPEESKDKDRPRIVYFTDAAWDALPKPGGGDPELHLFRNSEGRPWTTDAVNCAMAALFLRMEKADKPLPRKYCLYHFRHSWLDRMLKGGTDVLTCAVLMGHRDPSTLAKTYQHLSQSPDYLRAALKKAAG